jgi:methyltransferase
MTALYIIVGAVALQRLIELSLAAHNTRRLKAEGGVEAGATHYPLFLLLHGSWLLAMLLFTPHGAQVNLWLLALFIMLQCGRIWVIASLGKYWTTRIIIVPGKPLIRSGPYRFMRHPNYLIVMAEIATLPLMVGDIAIAIVWSFANGILLTWRIKTENAAMALKEC